MQDIKFNTLFDLMTRQLGFECVRIAKLILERNGLEEKQIGELALIPPRQTRKWVFELLRKGLLNWVEVPRRSDYHSKQTFHLWTMKLEQVSKYYISLCYKAILNLRNRRKELKRLNKGLDRFEAYNTSKYSEEQRKKIPGMWRYLKYQSALETLDKAWLNVARTILVLDFL